MSFVRRHQEEPRLSIPKSWRAKYQTASESIRWLFCVWRAHRIGVAAWARRAKVGRRRVMGRREMSRRPASARADNRSRKRAIGAPSYRFGSRRSDSSHAEWLGNGEKRD